MHVHVLDKEREGERESKPRNTQRMTDPGLTWTWPWLIKRRLIDDKQVYYVTNTLVMGADETIEQKSYFARDL